MRIVERHCWFPRNWMHFFLLTSTDDVETERFKLMHLLLLTVFYSAHLHVHSLPRKESRNREVFLELRIRRFVCTYVCICTNLKKHRRDITLPVYLLCQEYLLSRFSTLPSVLRILSIFIFHATPRHDAIQKLRITHRFVPVYRLEEERNVNV